MKKEKLTIVKIGGKVVENETLLYGFLSDFVEIPTKLILVHGGGSMATDLSEKLGIPTIMFEGRRITDARSLYVAIMVYAGLTNKKIVAAIQALDVNTVGLTGADFNTIRAKKRDSIPIDYGFVGDVYQVNTQFLSEIIGKNTIPVFNAITHDGKGNLLNTNADSIAAALAKALSEAFEVDLVYCFEKQGVLYNPEDENSVIQELTKKDFFDLKQKSVISAGMIPKIENCLSCINEGVNSVRICHADAICLIPNVGTKIIK